MKHSPSEPMLFNHNSSGDERNNSKYGNSLSISKPKALYPNPRSPERPVPQCQVRPMLKLPIKQPEPVFNNSNYYTKTEADYFKPAEAPVPSLSDKPVGLAIEDFLPVINLVLRKVRNQ